MNCAEARKQWQDQLDGSFVASEVDTHLANCQECREHVRQMAAVLEGLLELRRTTESIGAVQAANPLGSPERRMANWMTPAMRVAAAVAIVATTGLMITGRFGGFSSRPHAPIEAIVPTAVDKISPTAARSGPVPGLTLRGTSAGQFLAVAGAHPRSGVQVYWLYPTLKEETVSHP